METPNTDSIPSKERHSVVSYSINGILGLTSEPVSVQELSSKNSKEAEAAEGNYKRFSDDSSQPVRATTYILTRAGRAALFSLRKLQNWINVYARVIISTANLTRRCHWFTAKIATILILFRSSSFLFIKYNWAWIIPKWHSRFFVLRAALSLYTRSTQRSGDYLLDSAKLEGTCHW